MELQTGHRSDKDDESPVTIADYGAQVGFWRVEPDVRGRRLASCSALRQHTHAPLPDDHVHRADGEPQPVCRLTRGFTRFRHLRVPPPLPGAQALVAWSLQRSLPGQPFSLVAEEDAAELRQPTGAHMLESITQYVNSALAREHPEVRPACAPAGGSCCSSTRRADLARGRGRGSRPLEAARGRAWCGSGGSGAHQCRRVRACGCPQGSRCLARGPGRQRQPCSWPRIGVPSPCSLGRPVNLPGQPACRRRLCHPKTYWS